MAYIPSSWIHQRAMGAWISENGNRGLDAREQWSTPPKIRCDSYYYFLNVCYRILQHGDVIRSIYVETTKRNTGELQKPMHQSFCFADVRIRVSTIRNCCANAADHMTKSDLKRKSTIAAVITKWLSQGISFICGNVGTYKHFWIPRSSLK